MPCIQLVVNWISFHVNFHNKVVISNNEVQTSRQILRKCLLWHHSLFSSKPFGNYYNRTSFNPELFSIHTTQGGSSLVHFYSLTEFHFNEMLTNFLKVYFHFHSLQLQMHMLAKWSCYTYNLKSLTRQLTSGWHSQVTPLLISFAWKYLAFRVFHLKFFVVGFYFWGSFIFGEKWNILNAKKNKLTKNSIWKMFNQIAIEEYKLRKWVRCMDLI